MTAASYPVIRCDGSVHCDAETGYPGATTATAGRRGAREGHPPPARRDISPDGRKAGRR